MITHALSLHEHSYWRLGHKAPAGMSSAAGGGGSQWAEASTPAPSLYQRFKAAVKRLKQEVGARMRLLC